MEEGTGLGLYILVAAILFGLFALALALFGEQVEDFLGSLFGNAQSHANANLSNLP